VQTIRSRNPLAARCALVAVLCAMAAAPLRADYASTVLADGPKAYYRLNDSTVRSNVNENQGSLGASGNLTNTFNLVPIPGAIVGDPNRAQFFDTGSTYGMIPFAPALNPDNTKPFTIEAWFYPASDQISSGQCPMNNRVSSGVTDRTGWVFFQRAPNLYYEGKGGYEGVGWNCRMYRGSGGSSGLDVTSDVAYEVGQWTHVVVVYNPVDPVSNATLTMYINGVPASTNLWTGGDSGTDPGYAANPSETGAALSLGAYNNTSGAGGNAYFGGVDEFAFYATKLSDAQILAHYQNATNAHRAVSYDTLIRSDAPVVYLRLDEPAPGTRTAVNWGDVRAAGRATHTSEVRQAANSALAGRADDSAVAYHKRNGNSTTTMPWLAENNPNAGIPFTFEAWLRPMLDEQGGQCPVNNRWPKLGHRTGWVIFQRFPNASYANVPGINNEGHGWCFRMFDGATGSGHDVVTATDYSIGQWQHLVVTWEPLYQNGDVAGTGNDQWSGILNAYVDGVLVATNPDALYAANVNPPEDGGDPADFAIGAYNAASTLGNNPFEGDVDEVAFYNNYVLTPEQILAHYEAGTNAHPATSYEALVLTASYDGAGNQRLGPKTYLRFNEPADFPIANQGSAGPAADGNLVLTSNTEAGPQPPAYGGFEAANTAVPFDGLKSWASFNNPAELNISGHATLEAWVKPAATQGEMARIISHGPPTPSSYLVAPPDNAITNSAQVFLGIDGTGANYVVGSTLVVFTNADEVSSNTYRASFPVPAGDLGGADWIHLAGTYDGTTWRLYRNGAEVASEAAPVGALPVDNADWAIGSTGNGWADAFAGGIDEVAIYSTALSAAQIASHYQAAKGGTTAFTITAAGNMVTITWPTGTTLEEATAVTGPYKTVPGSPTSPLTVTAAGTRFYRWSQ